MYKFLTFLLYVLYTEEDIQQQVKHLQAEEAVRQMGLFNAYAETWDFIACVPLPPQAYATHAISQSLLLCVGFVMISTFGKQISANTVRLRIMKITLG